MLTGSSEDRPCQVLLQKGIFLTVPYSQSLKVAANFSEYPTGILVKKDHLFCTRLGRYDHDAEKRRTSPRKGRCWSCPGQGNFHLPWFSWRQPGRSTIAKEPWDWLRMVAHEEKVTGFLGALCNSLVFLPTDRPHSWWMNEMSPFFHSPTSSYWAGCLHGVKSATLFVDGLLTRAAILTRVVWCWPRFFCGWGHGDLPAT